MGLDEPGRAARPTSYQDVRVAALVMAAPSPRPPTTDRAAPRTDARAAAVQRTGPVRPRKLGHIVLGSTDQEASRRAPAVSTPAR
ncbi:hypothetical protein ACFVH6_41795 [Spirillospora sp. NPDC127200]